MKRLLNLLLAVSLAACAAPPTAPGQLSLALSADLPDSLDQVELKRDGEVVWSGESPFPEVLEIEVAAGSGRFEFVGRLSGVGRWYAAVEDAEISEGQTTELDFVLDPAGEVFLPTAGEDLGVEISIEAVPLDPPLNTPAVYPVRLDDSGYRAVVPAGDYRIDLYVETGIPGLRPRQSDMLSVGAGSVEIIDYQP